jgi:DNA-binding transcriptional ArsR family regulator
MARRKNQIPQVLRFIAHPLRRKLLVALATPDLTAAELSRRIRVPLNAVRYHLAVMKDKRMAIVNRRTRPFRYRLSTMVQVVFFDHNAVIAIRLSPLEEITLKIPSARRMAYAARLWLVDAALFRLDHYHWESRRRREAMPRST